MGATTPKYGWDDAEYARTHAWEVEKTNDQLADEAESKSSTDAEFLSFYSNEIENKLYADEYEVSDTSFVNMDSYTNTDFSDKTDTYVNMNTSYRLIKYDQKWAWKAYNNLLSVMWKSGDYKTDFPSTVFGNITSRFNQLGINNHVSWGSIDDDRKFIHATGIFQWVVEKKTNVINPSKKDFRIGVKTLTALADSSVVSRMQEITNWSPVLTDAEKIDNAKDEAETKLNNVDENIVITDTSSEVFNTNNLSNINYNNKTAEFKVNTSSDVLVVDVNGTVTIDQSKIPKKTDDWADTTEETFTVFITIDWERKEKEVTVVIPLKEAEGGSEVLTLEDAKDKANMKSIEIGGTNDNKVIDKNYRLPVPADIEYGDSGEVISFEYQLIGEDSSFLEITSDGTVIVNESKIPEWNAWETSEASFNIIYNFNWNFNKSSVVVKIEKKEKWADTEYTEIPTEEYFDDIISENVIIKKNKNGEYNAIKKTGSSIILTHNDSYWSFMIEENNITKYWFIYKTWKQTLISTVLEFEEILNTWYYIEKNIYKNSLSNDKIFYYVVEDKALSTTEVTTVTLDGTDYTFTWNEEDKKFDIEEKKDENRSNDNTEKFSSLEDINIAVSELPSSTDTKFNAETLKLLKKIEKGLEQWTIIYDKKVMWIDSELFGKVASSGDLDVDVVSLFNDIINKYGQ